MKTPNRIAFGRCDAQKCKIQDNKNGERAAEQKKEWASGHIQEGKHTHTKSNLI